MSCGKDDDSSDPDNNPPIVNPDTPVPDPEGTVTANISSSTRIDISDKNIYAYGIIGSIEWTEPDNFDLNDDRYHYYYYASSVSICDMGQMRGLGNITNIPQTGYSSPQYTNSAVACESGHGYVVKFERTDYFIYYVRLYVVEPIVSTLGGIMGAKVKYQYPFEPAN
jgi:hypothetical protein